MVDDLGSEVSGKIRQAIKAKLVELNAYVDDELPDYIMVKISIDKTGYIINDLLGQTHSAASSDSL